MNNSSIEQCFADWLLAAGMGAPVVTGSCAEQLSNDVRTVIVSVPEVQHVVGPLHKATVNLIVSAPAYHTALEGYRETVSSLRALVQAHQSNGLAAKLLAGASAQLGGVHIGESSEQIEDSRWINTLSLIAGLSSDTGN